MPAPSWRTRPARTISLCEIASASAGASFSVGSRYPLWRVIAASLFGPWRAGRDHAPARSGLNRIGRTADRPERGRHLAPRAPSHAMPRQSPLDKRAAIIGLLGLGWLLFAC